MPYFARTPAPPLSQSVQSLWLYSGYRPRHRLERVLPSGTVDLVINLRDDKLSCYDLDDLTRVETVRGPILAGPREGFAVIDTSEQFEMIGAHFHPGGAASILGLPVSELQGRDVSLQNCWGAAASELRDALATARTPELRLSILERALLQQFRPERRLHRAVRAALPRLELPDSPTKLGTLAAELGMSSRYFIATFREQVGLTPKAYGRIRRFQAALRRIHGKREIDWVTTALECGYYDQSHFIRDFRSFSGITPGAYEKLQGEHMNHVPLPEQGQFYPIPNAGTPIESAA
jgi:AraC-like DNA-binding protein